MPTKPDTDAATVRVLTTLDTLSSAADRIVARAASCAEDGRALSKNAVLNALAAEIAGPKHNWGFLTSRTGTVRDHRLPSDAADNQDAPVHAIPDTDIRAADTAPIIGPEALPMAALTEAGASGSPALVLWDRGHDPGDTRTPARIEVPLSCETIATLRAILAAGGPYPLQADGLMIARADLPGEDDGWLSVFHGDATTNLVRATSLQHVLSGLPQTLPDDGMRRALHDAFVFLGESDPSCVEALEGLSRESQVRALDDAVARCLVDRDARGAIHRAWHEDGAGGVRDVAIDSLWSELVHAAGALAEGPGREEPAGDTLWLVETVLDMDIAAPAPGHDWRADEGEPMWGVEWDVLEFSARAEAPDHYRVVLKRRDVFPAADAETAKRQAEDLHTQEPPVLDHRGWTILEAKAHSEAHLR